MTSEKYGVVEDAYCYPGSLVLKNRLDLRDEKSLADAERDMTSGAAAALEFLPPPYTLNSIRDVHRHLFGDIYSWAGELRTVDISKGQTRFCRASRIEAESGKLFDAMARLDWFEGMTRPELVRQVADAFGELNVVHRFREGNGRAQRILFEYVIINAGHEIRWGSVDKDDWVAANVSAYQGDGSPLERIFENCIGGLISGTSVP